MRKPYLICFLFLFAKVFSQVGINTVTPHAQLEIKSTDQANPANNDGVLIPKIDAFPAANPTVNQDGMLVYLTTTVGANEKGFYYWDNANSVWKGISGDKGWGLNGNSGTDADANFIGTTDDKAVVFKKNNFRAGLLNDSNTAFGIRTLQNASVLAGLIGFGNGLGNSAFGSLALSANTTGGTNNAFGGNSLKTNTTGSSNNAFGYNALNSNTTGSRNVAFGHQALYSNTSGSTNCAIGTESLISNTTGSNNIAIGNQALYSNTTGYYNNAFGISALAINITGHDNSAFGSASLNFNISGNRNSGFGDFSLNKNTSGNDNTALGYYSMVENTTGVENTAIGVGSLSLNTTGNDNVANGFYALPNNTTGSYNVANGYQALYSNTTGIGNNAHGNRALYSNVTGNNNTAFGNAALYNNTANGNAAVGNEALFSNTTGFFNTALGYQGLYYNTTGALNTAVGSGSLTFNTTGNNNCAFGDKALNGNVIGYNNVAIGTAALLINKGNRNVAVGADALVYNSSGAANVAIGDSASYRNTSGTGNGGYGQEANPTTTAGWNNIGVGFHSLGQIDNTTRARIYGNEIGYDNIAFGLVAGDRIGSNCNQSAFIGPFTNVIANDTNVSNATALGNGALVFQNNMMRLGNSAVTRIEAQVGLTVISDGRYKFNIKEEVKGLDFIRKLRPVVYQYDTEKMDREWMNVAFDTMAKHNPQILKDYKKSSQIRYSGFIAQEVEQAAKTIHYEFSGISKPDAANGHYGLDYASFVVPLVKSIQEQQNEIEGLKKQLAEEKNKNQEIEQRLKAIEKKLIGKF